MRWMTLTAATAVALLLAACSSSSGDTGTGNGGAGSDPRSSSAQHPGSAAPRNLKPQLLTAADLPEGWAVDNSAHDNGVSTSSCLKQLKPKLHTGNRAEADFMKGTDVPVFQESLGYYGNPAKAFAVFRNASRLLNGCRDVSFTTQGHTITGSIGQLSFPRISQHSVAWQLVLSGEGVRVGYDIVLIHRGPELAMLLYGDLGSPDFAEAKTIIRTAARKLPPH